MVADGDDDEASRILCAVAGRLHAPRRGPPPELVPLSRWFEALAPAARSHGGLLAEADAAARALLADPRDPVVLHGDIHHGNVLDAGARGWLAIDPKGLLGERTFDFVNILRNPDAATALAPGRFDRQVEVLTAAAALDRQRLLKWTLAFAGLSASWHLADGDAGRSRPRGRGFRGRGARRFPGRARRQSSIDFVATNDKRRKPCGASCSPASGLSRS